MISISLNIHINLSAVAAEIAVVGREGREGIREMKNVHQTRPEPSISTPGQFTTEFCVLMHPFNFHSQLFSFRFHSACKLTAPHGDATNHDSREFSDFTVKCWKFFSERTRGKTYTHDMTCQRAEHVNETSLNLLHWAYTLSAVCCTNFGGEIWDGCTGVVHRLLRFFYVLFSFSYYFFFLFSHS